MFKKLATAAAATALVFSATAAQAGAASALSLKSNPAVSGRASTAMKKRSNIIATPLLVILALLGATAVLEVTGAIDIFSDSP